MYNVQQIRLHLRQNETGKSMHERDGIHHSQWPDRRDEKPYFLWVGNMHGNEPTGRVLLLSLALHLASSKNALVQKVRNRMHTIIIPTMNPDGFKAADRNNACEPHVLPVHILSDQRK